MYTQMYMYICLPVSKLCYILCSANTLVMCENCLTTQSGYKKNPEVVFLSKVLDSHVRVNELTADAVSLLVWAVNFRQRH